MAHRGLLLPNEAWDGVAKELGWFSLALGAVELVVPGRLDRALGVGDHAGLTRAFGLREIAGGLGIHLSCDPTPWLWARISGDALDLTGLAFGLDRSNPHRSFALSAVANVAAITILDIAGALALSRRRRER